MASHTDQGQENDFARVHCHGEAYHLSQGEWNELTSKSLIWEYHALQLRSKPYMEGCHMEMCARHGVAASRDAEMVEKESMMGVESQMYCASERSCCIKSKRKDRISGIKILKECCRLASRDRMQRTSCLCQTSELLLI